MSERREQRKGPQKRQTDGGANVDRVARKLLERIEDKLQEDEGLEVKDFKTVSGALKEIHEICGKDKGGGESGTLTVRFVGETAEMSRLRGRTWQKPPIPHRFAEPPFSKGGQGARREATCREEEIRCRS